MRCVLPVLISIHALLAESDGIVISFIRGFFGISIHALLAESDCAAAPCPHGRCYFYPRSPCGERRVRCLRASLRPSFLSTLSLRRATVTAALAGADFVISIHALLAESDSYHCHSGQNQLEFLSTLSLRRATRHRQYSFDQRSVISIHALLAESDQDHERLPRH